METLSFEMFRTALGHIAEIGQGLPSVATSDQGFAMSAPLDEDRPVLMIRAGGHAWNRRAKANDGPTPIDLVILFIVEGSLEGTAGRRLVNARAGEILLLNVCQPMSLRSEYLRCCIVPAMPDTTPQLVAKGRGLHGRVLRKSEPLLPTSWSAINEVCRMIEANDRATAIEIVPAVLDLVELACHRPRKSPGTTSRIEEGRIAEIEAHIRNNIRDPGLTAASLSLSFDLSRATLYRMFEDVGGVARHIRDLRLEMALEELSFTRWKSGVIGQMARDYGFASQEAFGRAFKQRFGLSPRDVRANFARNTADTRRGATSR